MALRYWVGNTGNWSASANWSDTSGGSGGASVPTSADDVFVDANSFTGAGTITIDATAACLSLNFTGLAYAVTLYSSAYELSVYGSAIFNSNLSVQFITEAYPFSFRGTGSHNLTFNSCGWDCYRTNLSGGTYTLLDNWVFTGISVQRMYLSGTFDTNGFNLDMWSGSGFLHSGTPAPTMFYLRTGTHRIPYYYLTQGGIDSGTSTLHIQNTFNAGGNTFYDVLWSGLGDMQGANTFNNLTITGVNDRTVRYTIQSSITINGNLTVTGFNSANARALICARDGRTPITITCNGTVSVTNTDFSDIIAAGTADWDFSAASGGCGNGGGCSGITFSTPLTLYYVGTTAGIQEFSANTWSLSSGGVTGARVPILGDRAIFDANSFTNPVQFEANCGFHCSMDFSDVDVAVDFFMYYGVVYYYGDFILNSNVLMNTSIGSNWASYFRGDDYGDNIISTGALFNFGNTIYIEAKTGGSYTLYDALNVVNINVRTYSIFYPNGRTVTVTGTITGAYGIKSVNVDFLKTDGNTTGWYSHKDLLQEIGSGNQVSEWKDRSGNNHLRQTTESRQPVVNSDGVLFDGVDDYMVTDGTAQAAPMSYYMNFKRLTLNFYRTFLAKVTTGGFRLWESEVNSNIEASTNQYGARLLLGVQTYGRITATYNGGTSVTLRLNGGTPVIATVAEYDAPSAIALAASNSFSSNANIEVKELLIRDGVDDDDTQLLIDKYLQSGRNESVVTGTLTLKGMLSGRAGVGPELLQNRSFDTNLSGWSGTNWSWSSNNGGCATHTTGAISSLYQSAVLNYNQSKGYIVGFTVYDRTAGNITPIVGNANQGTTVFSNGRFEEIFENSTAQDAFFRMFPSSDFDGSIDDLSLREFHGSTVTGTLTEAVGGSGQITGSTPGTSVVEGALSGRASLSGRTDLGDEMISNGSFGTSDNWIFPETIWSYNSGSGRADFDGTANENLDQVNGAMASPMEAFKNYLLSFDIITNGLASLSFLTTDYSTYVDTADYAQGHYDLALFKGSSIGAGGLRIRGLSAGDAFSIDNISIKPIVYSEVTGTLTEAATGQQTVQIVGSSTGLSTVSATGTMKAFLSGNTGKSLNEALGLHAANAEVISGNNIRLTYDFTDDNQMLDFTPRGTCTWTRDDVNNLAQIRSGNTVVDSVRLNPLMNISRLFGRFTSRTGRNNHINFYTNLNEDWPGSWNPNPSLGIVGTGSYAFFVYNGSTVQTGLPFPTPGDSTASLDFIITDGSLYCHYVDSDQDIENTFNDSGISYVRRIDGMAAIGAYETDTDWSEVIFEGEVATLNDYGTTGATVTGTLSVVSTSGVLSGSISCQAVLSATISGTAILSGNTTCITTVTGTLSSGTELYGIISGTTTISGELKAKGLISAISIGENITIGHIIGLINISAISNGTSIVTGEIGSNILLTGSINGEALVTGILQNATPLGLAGVSYGTTNVQGTLKAYVSTQGTSQGLTQVTAQLSGSGVLLGQIESNTSTQAHLTGLFFISGTIVNTSIASGDIIGIGKLESLVSGETQLSGSILATGYMRAISNGETDLSGWLGSFIEVFGIINGYSQVTGELRILQLFILKGETFIINHETISNFNVDRDIENFNVDM